jgi:hypothetical protein
MGSEGVVLCSYSCLGREVFQIGFFDCGSLLEGFGCLIVRWIRSMLQESEVDETGEVRSIAR